tara:strand:- start:491 stop:793 length:303 start_codon:yes stop_codon:yes gene_type:complete
MLAYRNPEELVFKISLIQTWISLASRFKFSKQELSSFDQYFDTFKEFNDKHPNANFFEINNLLEDAIQALNRNLYMPLFFLNMMITIQTLLKGEKPKIII